MNQPLALPDAFNSVELLLRVDEVNLARAGLDALAAAAPDAARVHLLRGWVTLHERDAAFAAKHFRLAIGRDPLEPLAWHGLGSALPAGKAQTDANERAKRLSSSEPLADLRRGKPYLARAPLQLIHTNRPHEPEWTLWLVECLRRLGEIDAARQLLAPELDRVPLSAPAALLAAALEDDEIEVFEHLRNAARSDPAWITARRLWAPDGPPLRLPRPAEITLPPAVAARIDEIRNTALAPNGGEWRMAQIMTPHAAHRAMPSRPGGGSLAAKTLADKADEAAAQPEPSPDVAEVLREVQRATQRIFGQPRAQLAAGDAVALLVTHHGSLVRRYGAATAAEIERRIGQLAGALADRGLRGEILIVDQVAPGQYPGVPAVVNAAGDAGARAVATLIRAVRQSVDTHDQRLDAILIVGGDGVIPFHRFPNPSHDADGAVLSDNPYGCDGGSHHVPDIVVSRLPDGGADGGALLLALLQRSIEYHEGWLVTHDGPSGLALPSLRRLVAGSRPKAPVTALGATTAAWQEPSEEIYRELGDQRGLLICPPGGSEYPGRGRTLDWSDGRMLYFNLHGLTGGPNWYGQATGGRPDDPLPVALTPAHITDLEPAAICVTEACYGAEIIGRSPSDSMALRFLSRGALAFVGCTVTAYGAVELPLGGADVLVQQIFVNLRRGQPVGRAVLLARDWMARETINRQGYLDPDDAKTLLSFVLLGDPWASPYAKPVLQSKMALPAIEPVVAQRRPVQAGTLPPTTAEMAQRLVAKIAPQFARAPFTAQGQGRPDRIAKGQAGAVVFSASVALPTEDGRRFEQFARVTVAHGVLSKMLLSR